MLRKLENIRCYVKFFKWEGKITERIIQGKLHKG